MRAISTISHHQQRGSYLVRVRVRVGVGVGVRVRDRVRIWVRVRVRFRVRVRLRVRVRVRVRIRVRVRVVGCSGVRVSARHAVLVQDAYGPHPLALHVVQPRHRDELRVRARDGQARAAARRGADGLVRVRLRVRLLAALRGRAGR